MRIGIDASIVLHGERAGQRHTRNLLDALLRLHPQDDWVLLYFDRRGTTPGRLSFPPTRSCAERVSRLPMRLLLTPWRTLGYPSVEHWLGRIDVLYAPDLYFPPARRAPVLCTIRGVAYLAIPHLCEPEKVRILVRSFTYARRRAQHFLAVSESTRRDLLRYTDLPPERIHVVTHGVDPAFRPMDRAGCRTFVEQRFGLSRPFALYVGVIGRHKNVMGLLEAMTAAAAKVPGLDLALAGPFEPEIDRARSFVARSGLEGRVHFLGSVGQEDEALVRLYNAALALVHPTFYEGWSATPLEAMACGTPVVASDIPSVREVVGGAGALVPPHDVEAWADRLVRIAEDETWRAGLTEKGLSHVRQHTWERAARRLRQVLAFVQDTET
ncbi:MAG: glycosyltransferase family 1 protein [Nitrospirota bacterium]